MTGLPEIVTRFLNKDIGFAELRKAAMVSSSQCVHVPALSWYHCQECSEARGRLDLSGSWQRTRHSAYLFALGGNDAEMETIKALLNSFGYRWVQPKPEWHSYPFSPADLGLETEEVRIQTGPDFSQNYRMGTRCKGVEQVIFIECSPSLDFPKDQFVVKIDHHGERSGEPASVRQVIAFLGLELSSETLRFVELIAANDSGYIPAMESIGAAPEEISRIRAMDRAAQGITKEDEAEAERAIEKKEVMGRLTVVRMAHSKTATVADRLFGIADQLLIFSADGESNFYGDGAICAALNKKFGGWAGRSGLGKSGASAYWGGNADHLKVFEVVQSWLM